MKIIDIQPKDIHVSIELSMTEIDEISLAISKSKILVDSDQDVKEASKVLTDFFDMLNDVLSKVEKND